MSKNFLLKILGFNAHNFRNHEYILKACIEFDTKLFSEEHLEKCIKKVVRRSKIFNYVMEFNDDGTAYLKKNSFEKVNIAYESLQNDNLQIKETEIINYTDWVKPSSYLYQYIILPLENAGRCKAYFMVHHSIMDGIGLFNMLERLYRTMCNETYDDLDDNNTYFSKEKMYLKHKEFWVEKTKDYYGLSHAKQLEQVGTINVSFTEEELLQISDIRGETLMAALMSVIRTYPIFFPDDYEQFAMDFATNLRSGKKKKELGMYVNILPLFMDGIYKNTLEAAKHIINQELTGVLKHASYPVNKTGESFANVMLSYIPLSNLIDSKLSQDLDYRWLDTGRGPYELAYSILDDKDHIVLRLDYKIGKFSLNEISSYLNLFKDFMLSYLTMSVDKKSRIKLTDWSVTNPAEYVRKTQPKTDMTFEDLLDYTFRTNLPRVALFHEDKSITYDCLLYNVFENAKDLMSDIQDIDVIFLYGSPTLESFTMMITAIYLGKPYIFSGPKVPIHVIRQLTSEFKNIFFSNDSVEEITIRPYPEIRNDKTKELPDEIFKKTKHGLVTYFCTSGTTGEPKIIPVKRAGVCNLVHNDANTYIEEGDTSLLISSVTFDLTVDPIYRTFLKGGSLVIVDVEKIFQEDYMLNCISQSKADTLLGTPSALAGISDNIYKQLRKVGSVGEALTKSLANRLNSFENLKVYNCYGPTEATCYCHLIDITGEQYTEQGSDVSIGMDIDAMSSIVVDPFNKALPYHIKGELMLTGIGVLDDYHNYKGKERVFDRIDGIRYYHSGDICYSDGEKYYYVARKGSQVKINGYRIELSAIEDKLQTCLKLPFKLVVINNMLVVFHEDDISKEMLIEKLMNLLPAYMVPKSYFYIEVLPINKNQKVDVKKLKELYETTNTKTSNIPMNETEAYIYKVFVESLGISNISLEDELYELGGNSLTAIQISNTLKLRYNCVEFETIMQYQSVGKLANYINLQEGESSRYMFTYKSKDEYELTDMQKSMVLKHLVNKSDTSYHIGVLVPAKKMEEILPGIAKYVEQEKELHYNVGYREKSFFMKRNPNFKVIHARMELEDISDISKHIIPFNLFNDSLVRYYEVIIDGKADYYLMEMHHIISDGHTIQDILYNSLNQNKTVKFWEASEYADYKRKLIPMAQKDFFIEKVKNSMPTILNIDKKSETVQKRFVFSGNQQRKIRECKKVCGVSAQAYFSSIILQVFINKGYLDQVDKEYMIGTPINLRDLPELEYTKGPMIQMLPAFATPGNDFFAFKQSQNGIRDAVQNKFISYNDIVLQAGQELFQVVITSFSKYQGLGQTYIQEKALYPEKFGCTFFIYENNETIELEIFSNYLNSIELDHVLADISTMLEKGQSNILSLEKTKKEVARNE